MRRGRSAIFLALARWAGAALLTGCGPRMMDQPRMEPYAESDFFPDGLAMRRLPAGVIPFGGKGSELDRTGLDGEFLAGSIPLPVTRELLERGRERFDIHCSACHGYTGEGDGMIVQRGFPAPPTLHSERLRDAPPGHFVHVIAHGYGAMYPYASRVGPQDRWAIAAYIRALQLSRNGTMNDVPEEFRAGLEGKP